MRKLITGLRTEIFLNVAVLLIVAAAALGFVIVKVSEQTALDQKIKSGRIILSSIQNSIRHKETLLNPEQIENVQSLIDIFFESGDIDAITLVDGNMRIICHSSHNEIGKKESDETLKKGISEKKMTTSVQGGSVAIAGPIYFGKDAIGGVRVILSSSDVKEAAARSQRLILFYVVFNSLIIIVFGSILLSRTIVKPIDELVRATEAVAMGDLEQHIKIRRYNEIGLLAESFNIMTERLREGKEALEKNIRDLKSAQNEVIRAEKMATVGRLAAGIAHEIGNPLGAILGYTDILQKGVEKADESEYLRRIEQELQRIKRIVSGLLDYARPGEFKLVRMDLNESVKSSLDLVSTQKGFEKIDIGLNLDDIPTVMADTHQIQQVLINLFINAADAMPDGGTLTVSSRGVATPPVQGAQSLQEWVEISVTDTGTGISDEEIRKIFDPFYTTKEPGKGTGLGLAICIRIIESFGGRIEVASKKGGGSRFSILLPVTGEG